MKDMCIDFFCGLGGWTEGFLSEEYEVIGYDTVRHDYGTGGYPGQLVLQDVRTVHGSQFASLGDRLRCFVASPPCTEYSYMAMPWKRAKQIARALRGKDEFPAGYKGSRSIEELNLLFNECFRIQREANEAMGRHIPLIVENVKGAQPWVGEAKANFGSFYLWGDVGRIGNRVVCATGKIGSDIGLRPHKAQKLNPDGTAHPQGSWFAIADSKHRGAAQKVPGFRFDGSGKSFQSEAVKSTGQDWSRYAKTGEISPHWRMEAQKNNGGSWFNVAHNTGSGCGKNPVQRIEESGLKQVTSRKAGWFGEYVAGEQGTRNYGSKSAARASAEIAKIPFTLAQHIAKCFKIYE